MIQLCPDNTVLTKSAIHDIGKHFTKQSFIYFSELNFRSFSYNHFPKDSFLNKVVSTLRTKKNTKVESSLLQTDIPNHIFKSFQTKLSEILTFLSEFNNANCGISDGIVRFLHSDQNVRNAPGQTN